MAEKTEMQFIDSHAHIYLPAFEKDLEDVIRTAKEAGISKIFMPNVDTETIEAMLEAASRYPGYCIPMMGLHPCSVTGEYKKALDITYDWLQKRPFAAIGEIGLDLYWDKSYYKEQLEVLNIQLDWAVELGLPVVLHCRETMQDMLEIIEKRVNGGRLNGVFHCFTGTVEEARRAVDTGFYLGIGGVATFKNGGLDGVLQETSLERMLLETDSPYLTPVPYRGKRNDPSKLPLIADKIARVKNCSVEEIAEVCTGNTLKLFNQWE